MEDPEESNDVRGNACEGQLQKQNKAQEAEMGIEAGSSRGWSSVRATSEHPFLDTASSSDFAQEWERSKIHFELHRASIQSHRDQTSTS